MMNLLQLLKDTRAYYCLECGKCTAACPVARKDAHFSPRTLVEKVIEGQGKDALMEDQVWDCLTCRRCSEICPSNVRYSEFTRGLRALARQGGRRGHCTHGEVIQTWARLMRDPTRQQNRLDWIDDGLEVIVVRRGEHAVPSNADTVYFVGCLPYYEVLFHQLGAEGVAIARNTVKVMNALGVRPLLLAEERCCGHDQLWEGDLDTFRELAWLNAAMLRETGAKRVVTACPECARTLAVDYPEHGFRLGMEVIHLAQFLAENLDRLVTLPRSPLTWKRITYHDPCRLGRFMGVYEAPRKVLTVLGVQLVEMPYHRAKAVCCGTSAWTHCGAVSKAIQSDRLREAKATGAQVLVTACPKCQIHFKCAQEDPNLRQELSIEVRDLVTVVAEALEVE